MSVPKHPPRPQVAVIGAGPAGLVAAEVLARGGTEVTVYDRMPSAGRKLLMAGRGGLNLTHSETSEPFLARYGRAASTVPAAIDEVPPQAVPASPRGTRHPALALPRTTR